MSTVTQIMIASTGNLGSAVRQQLDEQSTQLANIQCALECLARGAVENDLRGTLQLISDCIGSVNNSILSISGNLAD